MLLAGLFNCKYKQYQAHGHFGYSLEKGSTRSDHEPRVGSSGTITEFIIPTSNSQLNGITAGPDGNLWFTEYGAKYDRVLVGFIGSSRTPLAAHIAV